MSNKNIWLHRISYHSEVSYPLLSKQYLSIGFSDFCEFFDFIDQTRNQKSWEYFESCFTEQWGSTPRTRYNLWRFIAEMQPGDWILVPSWGTFSVYELIGDGPRFIKDIDLSQILTWNQTPLKIGSDGKLYTTLEENEALVDLGFVWKVKKVEVGIPRYEYANAALTARMKIRNTNANISGLWDDVRNALDAYKVKKPINLYSKILDATVETVLDEIQKELNPDKFEKLVYWYFQRIGATNIFIPAKNEGDKEGDADVVATFELLKLIVYVQVKFHKGATNEFSTEQVIGYKTQKEDMDDGYSKVGWVISSARSFTEENYNFAKENRVQLIDGVQFTKLLLQAGLTSLDTAL